MSLKASLRPLPRKAPALTLTKFSPPEIPDPDQQCSLICLTDGAGVSFQALHVCLAGARHGGNGDFGNGTSFQLREGWDMRRVGELMAGSVLWHRSSAGMGQVLPEHFRALLMLGKGDPLQASHGQAE
ncbi:hypothetical protein P7K49_017393 [Saguinus oedipus]|uniref:Uncharacterized protein n=1 Tax=Saguinus oedipus TaxID=9490 RepID=A0ABQ9V523_SAGOE|nr:hypothetical protein P7K49_017393 [Saguinus oedipus]